MITINEAAARFAEPFTSVNGHTVCPVHENPEENDYSNILTEDVTRRINNITRQITENQDFFFTEDTIYNILQGLMMICPHCDELLDSIDYAADVREYGSATIQVSGVDDYNSSDTETNETTFNCPECNNDIDEERLFVFLPPEAMLLVNQFVQAALDGNHGQVVRIASINRPSSIAWEQLHGSNSVSFRPRALTGAGMETICDASVPIVTEDINMDQDLFDN
jgi:hypothetical protein